MAAVPSSPETTAASAVPSFPETAIRNQEDRRRNDRISDLATETIQGVTGWSLEARSSPYLNSEDYEGGFDRTEVENRLTNIECNFQPWARSFVTFAIGVNDPPSIEKFARRFMEMRPDITLSVARTLFLSDQRDILEIPSTLLPLPHRTTTGLAAAAPLRCEPHNLVSFPCNFCSPERVERTRDERRCIQLLESCFG